MFSMMGYGYGIGIAEKTVANIDHCAFCDHCEMIEHTRDARLS